MSYESKIYIVEINRHGKKILYAETLATMNLSCMGHNNGWQELFTKEIDYKLFMDDGDTEFDKDRYGDHLKSCSVVKALAWVEKEMQHSDYRRLLPLYNLLKGFHQERFGELEVVHFGY